MLYLFKARISARNISMKLDGDVLGNTEEEARYNIKTALAKQFGTGISNIDVTSMKPKRATK